MHRLAVIMFTDIVGYTALMGKDEERAMEVIGIYEQQIRDQTGAHEGEVVNFYGDGSLSTFDSVHSALKAAMAIQRSFTSRYSIPLRIGIHLGEAIFKNNNVYGDAVNIASRIESLGQAGAILFSQDVQDKVEADPAIQTQLIGEFEFKNVDQPMAIYALSNEGFHVPERQGMTGKLKQSEEGRQKRSIAVLPFEDLCPGDEQTYLVEGIEDELRSKLVAITGLKVISRSSSRYYKGKNYQLKDVADALDVVYVLEGRVATVRGKLRVNVDLTHARTDVHLWSMPAMDMSIEELNRMQNHVAEAVANELRVMLSEEERRRLNSEEQPDSGAFVSYTRGLELMHRGYGEVAELKEAIACFQEAIKQDPSFAKAYIGLADAYLEHLFWGRSPASELLEPATQAVNMALSLDRDNGEAYGTLGAIKFYRFQLMSASTFLEKAISLSPNHLAAVEKLAWVRLSQGRMEEALQLFGKARDLDPLSTKFIGDTGHAYYYARDFAQGLDYIEVHLRSRPNDPWLLWMKAYLQSGAEDFEGAIATFKQRDTSGKNTNWMLAYCLAKAGHTAPAEDILSLHLTRRKLDYVPAYMIATIYLGLGDRENALKYLELDLEEGGQGLFFAGLYADPKFNVLKDEPRFKALLDKVMWME